MTVPGGPLAGLKVLEVGASRPVAFCGKLLAMLGATVTKIEPPAGDPLRHDGPFAGEPGIESSIPFLFLNTGKRSLTVDLAGDGAPTEIARLAAATDVLLLDQASVAPRVDTSELRTQNPGLIATRISPFGEWGPHAGWQSSDIVQYAMSGWMHMTGSPDREPLAQGGGLAATLPGLAGAVATLMAVHARAATGRGQDIELSQQEVLALCVPYITLGYGYTGVLRRRTGMPFPMTIVPGADDGWLGINILTQAQWEALCAFTGMTDLLDDPRFADPLGRAMHSADITAALAAWSAPRKPSAVFHEAQAWRVPLAFVPELDEVSRLEQHLSRDFFQAVEHPPAPSLSHPRLPFRDDGRPAVRRAPLLGEHNGESLPDREPFFRPPRGERQHAAGPRQGPLEDVRIIDLTMWWSGPMTTKLFALMGAEVIKVESIQRVDGWRLAGRTVPELGIEGSQTFNGVNLNKQGVTLDLSRDQGRAILRRLVERADALVENYSARVMANLGLTDDVLREWNPNLVILSLPGFGIEGPWSGYVGFAPTIEQLSGLPRLTGYEGGPPALSGNSLADPTAGLTGALALMSAILAARRGAPPARLDLSQLEAMTFLLGEALLEQQALGQAPARTGNRDRHHAPQGCYPCAGDDRWLVLSVRDDAGWHALCGALERPDLALDASLSTLDGRRRHHDRIDEAIAAWTRSRDAIDAAELLQSHGIPAAPVMSPADLLADPHLAARHYFADLHRPGLGVHPHPGMPFHFAETPGLLYAASPTLGQHNDTVLEGILAIAKDEIDELIRLGIIGAEAL